MDRLGVVGCVLGVMLGGGGNVVVDLSAVKWDAWLRENTVKPSVVFVHPKALLAAIRVLYPGKYPMVRWAIARRKRARRRRGAIGCK